jgi:hypothetical protein
MAFLRGPSYPFVVISFFLPNNNQRDKEQLAERLFHAVTSAATIAAMASGHLPRKSADKITRSR